MPFLRWPVLRLIGIGFFLVLMVILSRPFLGLGCFHLFYRHLYHDLIISIPQRLFEYKQPADFVQTIEANSFS